MTRNRDSIVDASRPSAGRIYDYYLGGHHNFEVDRQTAEQVLQLLPFLRKMVRLQRWSLQDVAEELTINRGYDVIIDFASGIPTQDHLHAVVPSGTTVIYSDYDPVVVEYAREILGETPDVYFFEADARRPEEFLNRPELLDILGDRRRVAVVYWGIAGFLTDEEIIHAVRVLYDWTADGSCLAFNAQVADANPSDPSGARVLKIYEEMGTPIHVRSRDQYEELLRPWRVDQGGFVSLLDWHGFDESDLGEESRDAFGPTGAGYGVYLEK
ncbi:MAG: SAM-dependent methyltransferase [Chloroflexota bacterium]|nr:SAM-dependent methyltransferase [Chloroflexota bacterium]